MIHFMSSLSCEGFGQHVFCVFAGIVWVGSRHGEVHFVPSLAWSTEVEIYFVSSLAWDGFGQHKLRYILCMRWHGMDFFNTC